MTKVVFLDWWFREGAFMNQRVRARFWIEAVFAGILGVLLVITMISRGWIEILFGVDPDHGDGSVEWAVLGLIGIVCCVLSVSAHSEWRRVPVDTQIEEG